MERRGLMPHNAWDAGNPDLGLAGELGWIVSRHPPVVTGLSRLRLPRLPAVLSGGCPLSPVALNHGLVLLI